jgi:hypothetical protein
LLTMQTYYGMTCGPTEVEAAIRGCFSVDRSSHDKLPSLMRRSPAADADCGWVVKRTPINL